MVGLEVEQTKTSVAPDFGSLNSTLYRWKSGYLREVATLRFGMLRTQPFANSIAKTFSSFARVGLPAQVRFNAGLEFLRWHFKLIVRTGLAPSELGFSGRFAWRCVVKSGVLRTQKRRFLDEPYCPVDRQLPASPCVHNIVLRDEVEWVPSVSAEEEMMTRREIASWKWRKRGGFVKKLASMELAYWLGLSRPAVDPTRLAVIETGRRGIVDWYDEVKSAYFRPRNVEPKLVMLFKGIHRLPTYDEVIGGSSLSGDRLEITQPTSMSKSDVEERKQIDQLTLYEAGVTSRKAFPGQVLA
jgi:hypothetical protein